MRGPASLGSTRPSQLRCFYSQMYTHTHTSLPYLMISVFFKMRFGAKAFGHLKPKADRPSYGAMLKTHELPVIIWLWLKNPEFQNGNPGKWKHGPNKYAVCPSDPFFLRPTHAAQSWPLLSVSASGSDPLGQWDPIRGVHWPDLFAQKGVAPN